MSEVESRVVALIAQAIPEAKEGIRADTSLIQSGLLDSITLVELAKEIRNVFSIELPNASVKPANFRTPSHIVNMVLDELCKNNDSEPGASQ